MPKLFFPGSYRIDSRFPDLLHFVQTCLTAIGSREACMSFVDDPAAARPHLVTTISQLRQLVAQARAAGRRVGLVPTMGALHRGHLSLVQACLAECGLSVVTIFVNPTQFAPGEDFGRYPRTLKPDVDALRECGAHVVFAPSGEEVYPGGFSTYVDPPAVATRWEGESRPEHFRGVTTIVLKLFQMATADLAYFGQKDYQQAMVIRHMVRDLNVPIQIRVCPIVREADGLAMSSRNRYLDQQERRQAAALSASLNEAHAQVQGGQRQSAPVAARMHQVLTDAGIDRVDYIAIADPETLEPVPEIRGRAIAMIAAHVGQTRLIDNCYLETP
jgi:pantoate--beta-alanine ligase